MSQTISRPKRLLATMVIVGVIYADIAATANLTNWSLRLWLPQTVLQYFAMFRVFDSWDTHNQEIVAEVRTFGSGRGAGSGWRRFDLYSYFPAPPDDASIRIRSIYDRDSAALLDEIWEAYERAHPEESVAGVRLFIERWPKSPDGYEAERTQATQRLIAEL